MCCERNAETEKSGVAINVKLGKNSFFSPVRSFSLEKDEKWYTKLSAISPGVIIESDLLDRCMKTIGVLVRYLFVIFRSLQTECKDVKEVALKT